MSLKWAQKYKPRYDEIEGIKEIPVPNRIGNKYQWRPRLLSKADEESTLLGYKPLDGDESCDDINSNQFLRV
jgi:hypothetical protein